MHDSSNDAISVTAPEGKNYSSNIRLNTDDIELIEILKELNVH